MKILKEKTNWFEVMDILEITREWIVDGEPSFDWILVISSDPVCTWKYKLGLTKTNPWVYFNYPKVTLRAHQKYAYSKRPATLKEIFDYFILRRNNEK